MDTSLYMNNQSKEKCYVSFHCPERNAYNLLGYNVCKKLYLVLQMCPSGKYSYDVNPWTFDIGAYGYIFV